MKTLAVLTGAGISAESGLATFRGADGLWEGHRVQDVATPEAFARQPEVVARFYEERRKAGFAAMPNAAHLALAQLETAWNVHILTQNVDDLHERGGSSQIMHIHGELRKARPADADHPIVEWPEHETLAMLTARMGRAMRPHIVWFGEEVPLMEQCAQIVSVADAVWIVGTSLQVYPASGLMHYARPDAEVVYIDPYPATLSGKRVRVVAKTATEGVPALVAEMLTTATAS